jgi:hypothetical protein
MCKPVEGHQQQEDAKAELEQLPLWVSVIGKLNEWGVLAESQLTRKRDLIRVLGAVGPNPRQHA